MIAILGESGSGKSTTIKSFVEANPEYYKLVTYTTRPKRGDEKDGIDYHFVTQEAFDKLVEINFFAEHAKYREWSYGTPKADCDSDKCMAAITPAGLRSLKREGHDVTSIYLYVDRRSRLIQLLLRGDDIEEAYRRSLSDVGQFDGIMDEADYVIDNTRYHMAEPQILKCMKTILDDKQGD